VYPRGVKFREQEEEGNVDMCYDLLLLSWVRSALHCIGYAAYGTGVDSHSSRWVAWVLALFWSWL
jgi:hypothetical protein